MSAPNLQHLWAEALVDELARGGVRDAVISPGRRSAPLAWACAALRERDSDFRLWPIADERSAAFFALGLAKASGLPVLVLCTSGTAGAHFYPAVIEAEIGRVPLLLLTADRPPELHGFGANQAIDQKQLFGRYARAFHELGVPEPTESAFRHLRATASRAVTQARAGGPVHLNVPLREPLGRSSGPLPELSETASRGRSDGGAFLSFHSPQPTAAARALETLCDRLSRAERPVFVCGPRDGADGFGAQLKEAAEGAQVPVLAEATSNARAALAHYEAVLRVPEAAAALVPDLVVRFGGRLTTRILQGFVDDAGASEAFMVSVHEGGDPVDPHHSAHWVVEAPASQVVAALGRVRRGDDRYRAKWRELESAASGALRSLDARDAVLTEPAIARTVAGAMPDGSALWVSSSMPVRDLDAFAPAGCFSVFANRGAAGIDGTVSAAFGLSAAGRKAVLLSGDTAFFHDLGGLLWGARLKLPLVAVVVNNQGGRIFSFLADSAERESPPFQQLFTVPLEFDLQPAAQLAGAAFHRPKTVGALRDAVAHGCERGGVHLIDARVDGGATVAQHRALWAAAAEEVRRCL